VHRPSVTPGRLGAIHQARGALLAGGVPCAPPVLTRQGAAWVNLEGWLVAVEVYVDHDAVMDSWQRLEAGMALLAQVHNLLRDLEVGQEGRRPRFANHLEPAEVVVSMRRGVERIRGWDPTAAERRLAGVAEKLAELVSQAEVGLVVRLPASWSMVTSGTTTCCSATDGRCCWPTSTSWASGPALMTWP
jgi:hypothetical protein